MADADRPGLELLGRPGCHLCEAIWPQVLALCERTGLPAHHLDIERDPALLRTYAWRVPVVRLRGRVMAEGRIEAAELERAVARALGHVPVPSPAQRDDDGAARQPPA